MSWKWAVERHGACDVQCSSELAKENLPWRTDDARRRALDDDFLKRQLLGRHPRTCSPGTNSLSTDALHNEVLGTQN